MHQGSPWSRSKRRGQVQDGVWTPGCSNNRKISMAITAGVICWQETTKDSKLGQAVLQQAERRQKVLNQDLFTHNKEERMVYRKCLR